MALTLAVNPELDGVREFLSACDISQATIDTKTDCYAVIICGLKIRISKDMEHVVEQDLFPLRTKLNRTALNGMSMHSYRVRNAYSDSRVESVVGHKRLNAYRSVRQDSTASLIVSKSRMTGGRTPPPMIAIMLLPYYIKDMIAKDLGLEEYPEFLKLVSQIELLPDCPLEEELRGKWNKHKTADQVLPPTEQVEETTEDTSDLASLIRERDAARAEVINYKNRIEQAIVAHHKDISRKVKVVEEQSKKEIEELRKERDAKVAELSELCIKLRRQRSSLQERIKSRDETVRLITEIRDQLQSEVNILREHQLLFANPSRCGAYAEKTCGPYIASAFLDLGRTEQTAKVENHCADFIQSDSPWFMVIHELKYGQQVIASDVGLDKLLNDVANVEEKFQKPVLVATLISWRSNVSTMAETPIAFKIAPNGHTMILCVNNVEKQSLTEGGHEGVLKLAYQIARQHIEQKAILLHQLSRCALQTPNDLSQILERIFGTKIGTPANNFLSQRFNESLGGVTDLQEVLMQTRERGRSFLRTVRATRSGSRHWDTPRSVSAKRTVVIDDTHVESAEAVVDAQGVMAEAIDESSGMGARAEIDRVSGDMSATLTTQAVIGKFTRDGFTGAMVCKTFNQVTGKEVEYVYYNNQQVECIRGVEVPRYIPAEWHVLFDVKKGWGPADKEIAEAIMKVTFLKERSTVRRGELKKRLAKILSKERVGTEFYNHLGFIIKSERFTTGKCGLIQEIEFKVEDSQ